MKQEFRIPGASKPLGYIDLWTQSSAHVHIYDSGSMFRVLALALMPYWRTKSVAKQAISVFDYLITQNLHSEERPLRPLSILFSGHSMGAAIAVLLASFWKQKYPQDFVRLHTLGCPIFLSTKESMKLADMVNWIDYRYGFDLVPRIGLPWRERPMIGTMHRRALRKFRLSSFWRHHDINFYRGMVPYEI